MSSDVYTKPDSVRFNKKTEGEKSEWEEEEEVCIYKSADDVINNQTTFQLQDEEKLSQHQPEGKKKPQRFSKLCKILLLIVLFFMAAGAIAMVIYIILEINMNNSYSQQLNEIQANNSKILKQLKERMKQMEKKYEEMFCPVGWKIFRRSCYFRSTEKKTWSDSRKDCQARGADLVIINSREEQEFVAELNQKEDSWIGLEVRQIWLRYEWRWVDGSALTETFWETGCSDFTSGWWYAACCSELRKWKVSFHTSQLNWICENTF